MAQDYQHNRTLFHADNLAVLRGMGSETIDLIATDPPFKKGRDFHATPDSLAKGAKFQDRWSWERDVHDDWVKRIEGSRPFLMEAIESARYAHSDSMGAYMCFMAVRLLEMRRVLKETGSIYVHCDPTASHYLKAVMDAIFKPQRFRNEIVWSYGLGGSSKRYYSWKHDIILFYTASDEYTFDKPQVPATSNRMKGKTKGATSVWSIPSLNNMAKERTGAPTQKPLELYKRIVAASSNPDDVVLDPFAGCATTLVAAECLERQWVGIDIWAGAHEHVLNRMRESVGVFGRINYTTEIPELPEGDEPAGPDQQVIERYAEPGPRMTRTQMFRELIERHGQKCKGCEREFDDVRYLQLDHNTPRADGGIDHITNRVLLCGPCNRLKSNIYTLSGLRRENRKRGYMAKGRRI
ncbi:MAG: DNA methyltransferase [Chloroflexi bacterium]|nr:DNA methyltransferase [Chloroflexota bacterium]